MVMLRVMPPPFTESVAVRAVGALLAVNWRRMRPFPVPVATGTLSQSWLSTAVQDTLDVTLIERVSARGGKLVVLGETVSVVGNAPAWVMVRVRVKAPSVNDRVAVRGVVVPLADSLT